MAEILPRHLMYGFVFFTIFILGGLAVINLIDDDTSFISSSDDVTLQVFNNTFNAQDDLELTTQSMKTTIEGSRAEQTIFGVLGSLIKISWETIKYLGTTLGFMSAIFTGMSAMFPFIPPWLTGLLGISLIIVIVFAIFTVIFQREI